MTPSPWTLSDNFSWGDYTNAREAFGKDYMSKNPYTGVNPLSLTGGMSMSDAEVSGGVSPQAWQAFQDNDAYSSGIEKAFGATLSPEQAAHLKQISDERNAMMQKRGRMLGALALGGVAGIGALGAGFGGMTGAEGLGAGAFGDAATSAAWGSGAGLGGDTLSAMGLGGAAGAGAGGASASWAAGPFGDFLKNIGTKAGGNLLSQLISAGGNAYIGNKQAGQYNDVINQINQLYAPDSPYAQQMQQALARKDAAAGRNSQYGTRAVELAAALTNSKAQALTSPGFGSLLMQRGINQNIPINGFLAALGSGPGQNLITQAGGAAGNWLSKLFGSQGESVSPMSPNDVDSTWMPDWLAAAGG